MRMSTLCGAVAAALAVSMVIAAGASAAPVSPAAKIQRDGTFKIAGRDLRCGGVRNVVDHRLPSEGAAGPGVLVLNPRLMARMPEVVRLFVFHHECGHHRVGASELRADCWAVETGVRQGWLDKNALNQVCRSFGNAPETPTHPSGRRRCGNIDRCYANAVAKFAKKPAPPAEEKPGEKAASAGEAAPKLISGPKLIGSGILQSAGGGEDQSVSEIPPKRAVR